MENIRVFLNHLYFSLVIMVLVLIGIHIVALAVNNIVSTISGEGTFYEEFSVKQNLLWIGLFWAVASVGLASFLTWQTIKNRPVDDIVYTRRVR